jgi:hypothetical protein
MPGFEVNPKFLRPQQSMVLYTYEKLPPVGAIPQTRVQYKQRIEIGGLVPSWVSNIGSARQLRYLSAMRLYFDRSEEIDRLSAVEAVEKIKRHADPYSDEENAIVDERIADFDRFTGLASVKLRLKSCRVFAKFAFEKRERVTETAWGWATTVVRASPEEVLASLLNPMSRSKRKKSDLVKSIDEEPDDHNQLVYQRVLLPKLFADRDFLGRCIWKQMGHNSFVFVTQPVTSNRRPQGKDGVVRASFFSAVKITGLNATNTRLEYVLNPNAGTAIPRWIAVKMLASRLSRAQDIQEHFQSLRGLGQWDEEDGRAVGEVMLIKARGELHREKAESQIDARMRLLLKKYRGLREVHEKYDFFVGMMTRVVRNKLRSSGGVRSELVDVTTKEGKSIGAGLAMALASNLTSEAAVDEWIMRYTALRTLDQREVWFRPMANSVAARLLGEVSWGLKTRVAIGAGLGVLDVVSDINVIILYAGKEEHKSFMWFLLGMLLLSLFLQLCVCIVQNRRMKPKVVLREIVIVLAGLKSGFDAYRISSGAEIHRGQVFDPKMDMVFTKSIELFAEGIPGCILQVYVLLKSGHRSQPEIASIAISALTAGFTCASLSFDYDVDPAKRKDMPDFYGYIPNGVSRTVAFACMTLNGTLVLLLRSFSAALLTLMAKKYLLWYVACDQGLYLTQKVFRGDFQYWLPVGGALGFITSLCFRVAIKIITDFTGIVQFRNPTELGGLYWAINLLLTGIMSIVTVHEYFRRTPAVEQLLAKSEAWAIVRVLCGTFVLSFMVFLSVIKKRYRRTFFSTKLGKVATMERFASDVDSTKATIFRKNRAHWKAIERDVEEWVRSNWWDWQEEKPVWLTPAVIARIPAEFIPTEGHGATSDERGSGARISFVSGRRVSFTKRRAKGSGVTPTS